MPEPRILSIIPPMTQLNTPYPSTAYLTGFLRSRGFHAQQADLSHRAGVAAAVGRTGLQAIHEQVEALPRKRHTPGHALLCGALRGLPGDHRAGHSIPAGA